MGKMRSVVHQDDTSAARHYGLLRMLRKAVDAARPHAEHDRSLAEALEALDWFEGHGEPRSSHRPYEVGETVIRVSDLRHFKVEGIEHAPSRPSGFAVRIRDSGVLLERCSWDFVPVMGLFGGRRP